VITIIKPDHADQAMLLDHMDRVVAVMSLDEALELADSIGSLARQLQLVEIGAAERPSGLSGGAEPMCVVRSVPGELQAADVDWLGRHLARTKLGVALGAGGAKGFAHIGVLRTLERAGYAVDRIAGSSIGAWIGAWLALGMSADAIDRLMRERFTPNAVEAVFRRGAVRAGEPSGLEVLTRLARETTGERTFEQLEIPLVVMTADLHGRGPVPITSGPLHEALVAAMTVPGLYAPVLRGSQRLVDAVVLTPVPIGAMIGSGADVTVAVNLLGREALASWPGDRTPAQTPADGAARDTVLEALEVAQIDASARQTALANVSITPRFGPGTWRQFHLADRYLAAGAEAAAAALPVLQALARSQGMSGHDAADQGP
jgi:NTE family protein